MHRWSSHPLWQMLFQFRSFALGAWDKQFLHNIHMRDWESFHMMWMSMALGAATYAARTQIQAIGRSDSAAWLNKRLAPDMMAKAAFQMAGWSSILPMVFDTGLRLGGLNPVFDFRTTGQATDALLGNPTTDLFNSVTDASRAVTQSSIEGRSISQKEWRSLSRLLPMNTWYPFVPILNSMIQSAPPYPSKS
jgi:hypothetical protein